MYCVHVLCTCTCIVYMYCVHGCLYICVLCMYLACSVCVFAYSYALMSLDYSTWIVWLWEPELGIKHIFGGIPTLSIQSLVLIFICTLYS